MPKKIPEELRMKAVELRKKGATYTQIEAEVVNPETGEPIQRPTLIKILKEAGLTRARAAATTPPSSSAGTPSTNQSKPAPTSSISASNGVSEFMPKPRPKAKVEVEFECEHCGTEFVCEEGDDLPETCPECKQ